MPIKLVFNKKDIAENMRIAETVKERRVVRIFQLFQSSINPSKTKDHSEKTCHIDFYHKPLKAILDKSGSVKSVLFDRGRRKLSQLATDLIITATGFSNDDRSPQSQLCHDNFKCFHIVGWAALGPRGTLAATFNQVDQVVEEIMGSAKSKSLPTKYSEDFNPLFALRVPFLNKTDLKIIVEQGIRMGNLLGRDFQYLSDLKVSRSWDLK